MSERYVVFTRGCFDCLHLGHFSLLASMLVESSKILNCSPCNIEFNLSIASQKTEISKNIKYNDSEEIRLNNIKKLGLIKEATVDLRTLFRIRKLYKKNLKCFCIGSDQDRREPFMSIITECKQKNIMVLKISNKVNGISSTMIRNLMTEKSLNAHEARIELESDIILDNKIRNDILFLKNKKIINKQILEYFNLDDEIMTQRMRNEISKSKSGT
jgi:FAD synthase